MAFESAVVKIAQDGKLTLYDGTAIPQSLEVQYSKGDFKSSLGPGKVTSGNLKPQESLVIMVRGAPVTIRNAEQKGIKFSFSAYLTGLSDATKQTIQDFVHSMGTYAVGGATPRVTTSTIGGDRSLCDLWLTIEGTDLGDSSDHIGKFLQCDIEECSIGEAADGDTIDISGTCWGGYTPT